jgi:hypothetical protein
VEIVFMLTCCSKFHPRISMCSEFFWVAADYVSR